MNGLANWMNCKIFLQKEHEIIVLETNISFLALCK